ncbi:MAG: 2-C-methyl-D-erythritol 4-phosphate cytidylyltransferase [Acidimicrobiales bacterium]
MVAGGTGRRFGGPKQFLHLAGRPVVAWAVDAARSVSDGVVVVVPAADVAPRGPAAALGADRIVAGGATRSDSVRAGLAAVPDDAGIVVVHDAARPLAGAALFAAVVEAVRAGGVDGAIPVVPVADTLKRVVDGRVRATVDREGLVSVQTPQAFVAAVLRAAHRDAGEATDDASLLERLGATVRTVEGDPRNLKLTRATDLQLAESLIGAATR